MDIGRILSRSLELMWKYKFVWLFGLIMGLTSGGGGFNGSGSNNRVDSFNNPFVGQSPAPAVIALAVIVGLIFLVAFLVLFFYFRFVARGALVTTVRDAEAQDTPTLRGEWQNGRKFYTRLLGLGFLVNVPLALLAIVAILLSALPLIGMIVAQNQSRANLAPGWVAAALALCCTILCVVVVGFVIHPLYEFAVRAIVLEDLSVREGLRRGIQQARANVGNTILVYVVLIGARIGYTIVSLIVAIPILLVFLFGGIALLRSDLNAFILLVLVLIIPLWLLFGALEGIFQIFESNVWTEAYLTLENKPVVPETPPVA